jgi:hypothetical protein
MARNLQLPVKSLQGLDHAYDPGAIASAAGAVVDYLTDGNPHFLTYRFGSDEGAAMKAGMAQLRDLAQWTAQSGYSLAVQPIRCYRRQGSDEEIVEHSVSKPHR